MKFAALVFLAGLCLMAVTAQATHESYPNYDDFYYKDSSEQDLSIELIEVETQSAFSGIFLALLKIFRTLKKIGCVIDEVLRVEEAAQNFLADIAGCGHEANKKVQNLVDAITDIIDTCKAIIGINEHVCANTRDKRSIKTVVSGAIKAHRCAANMIKKLLRLTRQIKHAIKLIAQIKKAPGDINRCTRKAIDKLETSFIEFPTNIKACAKPSAPHLTYK